MGTSESNTLGNGELNKFQKTHAEQEVIGRGKSSMLVSVLDGVSYLALTTSAHLAGVRAMNVRDDDIWIISYPKSGTHWMWEIANMLRNQSAEICRDTGTKDLKLLDFARAPGLLDTIDRAPPPRLLMCHLLPKNMPEQLWSSNAKIIYPYRNPKDALVSLFHHYSTMKGHTPHSFNGTWEDWIELSLQFPEKALFGGLVKHVHDWMERGQEMPRKFLAVEYEAIKKDSSEGVQRIADFLGFPLSPDLKKHIVDQTSIEKLKLVKLYQMIGPQAKFQHRFFRKGEVGGWKSEFTVAQNEAMDAFLNSNPLYKDLSFTYTAQFQKC